MFDYNLVYLAVWGLAFISILVRNLKVDYLYVMQISILTLFLALKFETGYDWPVYEAHFFNVSAGESFNLNFEIGYELLVHMFSAMGFKFHQFIAIVSILEVILVAAAVRFFFPNYRLWVMAIIFAIPDFYLIPYFSLVRQGLAASLFFYGVRYYAENKRFLSWLIFGLAVSLHYSVVGALILFSLAFKIKLSKNVFLTLFALSVFFYLSSIDVVRSFVEQIVVYLDPKYMIYLDRDVYNASMLYRGVYACVSAIIFALIYMSWRRQDFESSDPKLSPSIHRLAMFGILIPLVVYGFPTFSTRYQFFFCIFTVGISFTSLARFNARDRFAVLMVTCFLAYIPFYRFLSNPLSIVYIPYQSQIFFDKSNSTGQQRTDDLLNQLDVLWSK
ncbi:EpsG family protein [Pseudomonas sp. MUP55]|uniref:EpsG family protein n=1 Tax=Pseudomonas sp. MUP55 TaxID=3087234 RepID=UPI002A5A1B7F|nr:MULTISPECIES: EpsG family protein [unclassified Pseudomonas]WPN94327.1 EpsG family protein [Pseudomonas sp. MUP56]WPN99854.1 EpsG family protein [Pseudomonas sp. MUP55]